MPRLSTNSALWATRVLSVVALLGLLPWAINSATSGRSALARGVASSVWWFVAGVVMIALVICGQISLTIIRMLACSSVPVAGATLVLGASAVPGVVALVGAVLTTLAAFTAEAGEAVVQVSAYGDERRIPLRVPAAMQVPLAVSWLLWFATSLAGVVVLAADRKIVGIGLLVVAGALTCLVGRRLHRFACRWLVSVPAGLVVHDPVVLAETLMVLRSNIDRAHLALAGTEAADLTGPAAGHALEITVREMVQVVLAASPKNPKGTAIHAQSFLVAPSRPGRAMSALAARRIAVSKHLNN